MLLKVENSSCWIQAGANDAISFVNYAPVRYNGKLRFLTFIIENKTIYLFIYFYSFKLRDKGYILFD